MRGPQPFEDYNASGLRSRDPQDTNHSGTFYQKSMIQQRASDLVKQPKQDMASSVMEFKPNMFAASVVDKPSEGGHGAGGYRSTIMDSVAQSDMD